MLELGFATPKLRALFQFRRFDAARGGGGGEQGGWVAAGREFWAEFWRAPPKLPMNKKESTDHDANL